MMNLNDFLTLTLEQEAELLTAAYASMENSYDRYRALIAVEAIAGGGEDHE